MRTEKTICESGQWVKITRDAKKGFTFARGWNGEFKAHDIKKWSAKYMPTWKDATEHAKQMIEDWK